MRETPGDQLMIRKHPFSFMFSVKEGVLSRDTEISSGGK